MKPVLGLCVARQELRAVLSRGDEILWAARAPCASPEDIAPGIGHLAGLLPHPAKRVRVVLDRDLVQLRTVAPVPPLAAAAARRYVALEANRLFRKNGVPLVTDARVLEPMPRHRVLWAAAVPEPVVRAVVRGCEEGGLQLDALGPATEVLPSVVRRPATSAELSFPNGSTCERIAVAACGAWQSRLVLGAAAEVRPGLPEWVPSLAATKEQAPILAAAYGATVRRPALDLLPPETRAARLRQGRRRLVRGALVGVALWAAAGLVHLVRLEVLGRATERAIELLQPAVDSAVALRRDLNAARAALGTIRDAERRRSRTLLLLADLTNRLGEHAFLAAFQLAPDSTLRLVGYAPQAARVLAQLERAPWVRDARLEAPVMRERAGVSGEELDRFSLVAQVRRMP